MPEPTRLIVLNYEDAESIAINREGGLDSG
jgi:hypothetical protein